MERIIAGFLLRDAAINSYKIMVFSKGTSGLASIQSVLI